MPTDRVHCLPQQAQLGAIPPDTPQPATSDATTQPQHARPDSERETLHPLRREAPVTSRCTRYVSLHPIRSGVMPTDRVHRLPQQAQPRTIPPHRPQPTASDAATQPPNARPGSEQEALHPIRRDAPDQKRCNAYGSGAPPPTTNPTADNPSPQTPTGSIGRSHEMLAPGSEQEALHPLRRDAPVTSRCTRSEGV